MYRVFQHPLKEFDGPRLAAVSKLWHSGQMITTENHLLLDSLRAKYGSIIRTGENHFPPSDLDAKIQRPSFSPFRTFILCQLAVCVMSGCVMSGAVN